MAVTRTSILAVAACLSMCGCTPASQPVPELASGVRCDGVRALRLGMSESQVVDLIGEPTLRQSLNRSNRIEVEQWQYGSGHFWLEFGPPGPGQRLMFASASLGKPHLFTEATTRVFTLATPGSAGDEGEQFDRFFRCAAK